MRTQQAVLWAGVWTAVLMAAAPARAVEQSDGLPGGNRIPWSEVGGGGVGASSHTATGLTLQSFVAPLSGPTASGGPFQFIPGVMALSGAAVTVSGGGGGNTSSLLGDMRAYPVPYKPGVHAGGIQFGGLRGSGTIRILTLDGDPVKTLTFADGALRLTWDPVLNDAGEALASNVYIYLVEGGGVRKVGQLIISR